jgi:hypothetical protein
MNQARSLYALHSLYGALIAFSMACTSAPPSGDTTAPTVTLTSSASNVTSAGSIVLTAEASDNVAVVRTEFYEGSRQLGEDTSRPFDFEQAFVRADNGTKSYTAKAFDAAGNSAVSSPATQVVVDIPAPRFVDIGNPLEFRRGTSTRVGDRALALDRTGNPTMVWQEAAPSGGAWIVVGRWNGSDWEIFGNEDPRSRPTGFDGVIALDNAGNPTVAWAEDVDNTPRNYAKLQIYVKRWVGGEWQIIGGAGLGVNSALSASNPSMALDSSGRPTVSWIEYDVEPFDRTGNAYVKRWNGATWELLGNAPLNGVPGNTPSDTSVSLDASGNPVVAISETGADGTRLFVKRWTGTAWQTLGNSPLNVNMNNTVGDASLALDANGRPTVAFVEHRSQIFRIYVKRWTGTAWQLLGNGYVKINEKDINAFSPSLALDSSGSPVLAWHEKNGNLFDVYAARWVGSAWEQLSDAPVNVSSPSEADSPAVALDLIGNPTVAWVGPNNDGININSRVRVSRLVQP